MVRIEKNEFTKVVSDCNCRSQLEHENSVSPEFWKYTIDSQEFLKKNGVYSIWRTNEDRTAFVSDFRASAFPITFNELAKNQDLFPKFDFQPTSNYFGNQDIIVYHCKSCGIRVVKDGNHRLLQCVLENINPNITAYEAASSNWLTSNVDMKNFCRCFSANTAG